MKSRTLRFQADGRAINEKVRLYARVGTALIAARDSKQDAFDAIATVIPWDRFRATVAEAEALARSEEFDAYQMLGEHYAGIRRWAPTFLDAFVFQSVPAGDAYLLKHVIHDWPDDRATTILRNCRKAVRAGGKLLLVEVVLAPGNAADLGKVLDLEMLVIASGRERTEAEYRQLLAGAGWRLTRVLPTKSPTQIVEAEPA